MAQTRQKWFLKFLTPNFQELKTLIYNFRLLFCVVFTHHQMSANQVILSRTNDTYKTYNRFFGEVLD